MATKFFSTKQIACESNESLQIMLLSGPPSCGKTSLLFQFAINCLLSTNKDDRGITGSDDYVVFICNRIRLENKPPFLSQGINPSSSVFERIQIKYVEDDEDLKKYFAASHLHGKFPKAVIVDDFGDFFQETCNLRYGGNQRGRDLAMVRTLALCHDAINHANKRMDSSNGGGEGLCKLLLSDSHHGDTPRSLFIYKRWVPSIFTIKGEGSGSFLLSSISGSSSSSSSIATESSSSSLSGRKNGSTVVKYSIALQYLMVEEIIEQTV